MEQKKKRRFRGYSLQFTMIQSMTLLLALVTVLLWVALSETAFFYRIDQQNLSSFYSKAEEKVEEINLKLARIVENLVISSGHMTELLTTETAVLREELGTADLTSRDYLSARVNSAEILLKLLDDMAVDGAFYLLFHENGLVSSGIHVRNTYPTRFSKTRDTYELVVGSSQISQTYGLNISKDWALDFEGKHNESEEYLQAPLEELKKNPYLPLEAYGYWFVPTLESHDDVIYYTLPLVDDLQQAYGLIGIEISEKYFLDEYLSTGESGYENSIHFLGKVQDNVLQSFTGTPNFSYSNALKDGSITLKEVENTEHSLYRVVSDKGENLLCTVHNLGMYSHSSPFEDETWEILTFVPEEIPYSNSREIQSIFFRCFVVVLVLSLMIAVFVARMSTLKIVGLSAYVYNLKPHQEMNFQPTNLKEIDDLTTALSRLSEKVVESSSTLDRIISLTALDMGGFEELQDENGVVLTEYIRRLLQIPMDYWVNLEEWAVFYAKLTKESVNDMENTYVFETNGEKIWLRILTSRANQGLVGMVQDVSKEIQEAMEVKYQLDYDALTGLFSRGAFHRESARLVENYPNATGAMIFIDLDNLKYTNDTYGHEAGDDLITTASDIFREFSVFGGISARFSGDEFGIFIHNYGSREDTLSLITQHFEKHKHATIQVSDGSTQRIRFSTGVAWFPEDSSDMSQLVKMADFAMYQAKHNAKGTLREFDHKIYKETAFMMENREAIHKLIEEKLVRFMFQPIVDLKTGETVAFEALMRSQLDAFKTPLEILKVAEAQSKLGELEKMLVECTVADAYEKRERLGNRKIFINSISSQSMSREEFSQLEAKYGDFLQNIVIEITDDDWENEETRKEKVMNVRNFGMQLAIDDFVGGYVGEVSIVAVNPDLIKMDMTLGQGIAMDEDKKRLLSSIVEFSHAKGIEIIAEGIEKLEDLEQVLSLGTDYAQGFVIGRPDYEILDVKVEIREKIIELREKTN